MIAKTKLKAPDVAPIFQGAVTSMERVRPDEEGGPRRTVGLRAITPASLAAEVAGADANGTAALHITVDTSGAVRQLRSLADDIAALPGVNPS